MPNITVFDPADHHIRFVGAMKVSDGSRYEFRAVLDTGAPVTEFSDQFLYAAGLIPAVDASVSIKTGLQTQKYGKLILPQVEICGHALKDMPIFLSHFENHWGVDALIGL
ncbi:MAG: hypothetical protein WC690_03140, partial [bacterium]